MKLYDDERIDYLLHDESIKIIQSPTIFSYSLDAVLLAHFTYMPINKGNILDLCTGNGAVPLLLSKRTYGNIVGLEIKERLSKRQNGRTALNEHVEKNTMAN